MTENGGNVTAASNDEEKAKLCNISAYDAITEVISHGIKHFQYLNEFFKGQIGEKVCWSTYHRHCYPTVLLNYAKTGPCEEAYKVRTNILKEISNKFQEHGAEPKIYTVDELLDILNMTYPFIFKEKFCSDCELGISHNLRSLNLLNLSRNTSTWKHYDVLQPMLDRYFARKTKQCCRCREDYDCYYVDPGPLLCINVETLYERVFEKSTNTPVEILLRVACTSMVKNSLDMLPRRLTVKRSTYVLYGVIERSKDSGNVEKHYVAYCRNPDDSWERRDGIGGEKKSLSDLSVDTIAMVFYADIGCWDEDERILLLELAKSTLYELTTVELPELCLENMFSFLDNWQLKTFIRSSEDKYTGCIFTSLSSDTERDDMSVVSLRSDSPEYKEQDRRARNVLIHNLPIGDDISDIDRVKSLLILLPISRCMDLDNIRVRRYREVLKDEKFPITVVTFQTQVEADWCISARRKLALNGIIIRGDYTDWQKSQLEKLKVKARRHNKSYPNDRKAAFFKSGVPVLVKKKKRPRAEAEPSKTTDGCSEKE